jgi:GT2 family glycosyltransferase
MDSEQASRSTSIIVVPRERFSLAPAALDRLLELTPPGYELIYIDGGSPPHIAEALRQRADRHGFPLVRLERMLSPNHARNVGLQIAERPYVVFLDNDTLVSPDWLRPLVDCAAQTGAGVVGPLYLEGPFEDDVVHMAGGSWQISARAGKRWITAEHVATRQSRSAVAVLTRHPVDFVEFHCVLVQRALLARLGPFDERIRGTADHIDLALAAHDAGGVYLEPASLVSYMPSAELDLFDLSFFTLRWSRDWNEGSLQALAERWNLDPNSTFIVDQRDWTNHNGVRFGIALQPPEVARRTLPASSAVVAQTNIALYRQMELEQYPAPAVELVKRAYGLAQIMFGGAFRASGKTFLAHVVGTASILAAYRQPAILLAAALLHAAYSHGSFPPELDEEQRRDWLRQRIGEDVERLVWAYRRWQGEGRYPQTAADLAGVQAHSAVAVIIALANDIEDHVDGAPALSHQAPPDSAERRAFFTVVANILHLPGLARSYELALQQQGDSALAPVLRSDARDSYRMGSGGERMAVR